jgi:stage V sporulation protein G
MDITEVRVKLVTNPSERLRAFCSVTLNGDFVIRDLKVIEGLNGAFVAMPSRKLSDRCPRCGCKNHLRARFCNECGTHLKENRAPKDGQGRAKLHADIAHPINAACRERIQNAVVEAYEAEFERSKSPDYKPQCFDDFDDYESEFVADTREAVAETASVPVQPDSRGGADNEDQFSDYNSLIADLKRDAADRRQVPGESAQDRSAKAPSLSYRLPPSEGENAVGKPAYRRLPRPVDPRAAEAPELPVAAKPAAEPDPGKKDGFGAGLV